MKCIGITGGTGLVGRHLSRLLADDGYQVIVFTRKPDKNRKYIKNTIYAEWNPRKGKIDTEKLAMVEGIVHLAGEGIADKRWTAQRKTNIVDSRVQSTEFLCEQLKLHAPACKTLVCASAIGFYGADSGGGPFTEDASPATDFLGHTCMLWEDASAPIQDILRRVILRVGIVLAREAGAFHEFAQPLRFGIMPVLGSGEQVVSWIHITDLARMMRFALERHEMTGTFNAVAPEPVTHVTLMRSMARAKGGLRIPLPVPAFILKPVVGEMSVEVLKSCTVSAAKTLSQGFRYQFTDIDEACKDLWK